MAATAVYDGHCVICNTTRRIIGAMDWFGRVEFLDLHDRAQVEARFPMLDYDTLMGEIHVVDGRGQVFAGFYGTRRMLREVPLGVPLWALLHLPGVRGWLGPRLYRFIARNRYAINRFFGVELPQSEDTCDNGICKLPY